MRARAGTAALILVALGWAAVVIPPGANQTAHLATVVSLSEGSPDIDAHRSWTGDTAYVNGHFYSAKAPGLALWSVPYYVGLKAVGLVPAAPASDVPFPQAQESIPPRLLWELALWGAVVPGLVLLFLVRAVAGRMVPGYGTIAAVAVGTTGILAVMATMFFAHALSACLGFAAFACLFLRPGSRRATLAAGLLAGLAVTVELPLALVVLALGGYVLWRDRSVRAVAAYGASALVGALPLLAFDLWAFGSPFTLAYSHAVAVPGASGHDVMGQNASGFFGIGVPDPFGVTELLFSGYGLLVLAPVWTAAGLGVVLLWRSARRGEAVLVAALAVAFLVYNGAYKDLFGAMTAGPRFLSPLIPFLALGLAAAWQRLPLTTTALYLVSVVTTAVLVTGNPMGPAEDLGTYVSRLREASEGRAGVSGTVLQWVVQGSPRAQLLVVAALVAAAVALALWTTPLAFTRLDAALAVGSLVGWRVLYSSGTALHKFDVSNGGNRGAAATLVAAVAVVTVLLAASRRTPLALPGLVLLALLWTRAAGSPRVVALVAAVALASAVAALVLPRFTGSGPRRAAEG